MSAKPDNAQRESFKVKEPEHPEINISSKKEPKSYKLTCKYALRKFGFVELRSLGNASESVVALAESLVRNRYAVYEKIESGLTDLADVNNDTGTRKGIKFVVRLKKSAEFDQLAATLPPPDK